MTELTVDMAQSLSKCHKSHKKKKQQLKRENLKPRILLYYLQALKTMLSSFFSCLLTLIESLYEILKNIATFLFSPKEVIEFPSAGYKVEIENKIADGGFSVVYLVSDKSRTNGGQRYAMKRVICGDGEMEDGCQKEIEVHRR